MRQYICAALIGCSWNPSHAGKATVHEVGVNPVEARYIKRSQKLSYEFICAWNHLTRNAFDEIPPKFRWRPTVDDGLAGFRNGH